MKLPGSEISPTANDARLENGACGWKPSDKQLPRRQVRPARRKWPPRHESAVRTSLCTGEGCRFGRPLAAWGSRCRRRWPGSPSGSPRSARVSTGPRVTSMSTTRRLLWRSAGTGAIAGRAGIALGSFGARGCLPRQSASGWGSRKVPCTSWSEKLRGQLTRQITTMRPTMSMSEIGPTRRPL